MSQLRGIALQAFMRSLTRKVKTIFKLMLKTVFTVRLVTSKIHLKTSTGHRPKEEVDQTILGCKPT
jgi:hypothetical protein